MNRAHPSLGRLGMNEHRADLRNAALPVRGDSEGLWDWNLQSDRIHFSPQWLSLAGLQDHELGNTVDDWLQRVHPDDIDDLWRDIDVARAEGSAFEFRYRLRHKDGSHRWMASRGVVVRNDRGEAIRLTGNQSDVTVETVTDILTGLPNRLLLLDRLSQSIDRARRYRAFHFAILIMDLGRPAGQDRPSRHGAADPLLTAAARRLETCLRNPEMTPSVRHNDVVARLDGDRFAILLDGLKDVYDAKLVADRMLGEMLSPFAMSGREIRLGTSVGIAVSATGYTRPADVLRDAETALHRARMLGGSHCELFDTALLQSEQNELSLAGEFERALERREFELFYQPVVSLTSNQVVGFEALVRWKHPVRGLITPLDFIPLAEASGFIVPLGNWIMREACLQLRTWQSTVSTATDLWMSVNLSSVQLAHEGVVDEIAEILNESEIEPRSLVLELTEGVAMDNPTAARSLLMRLRAMGVRISIDDFGTGYSSLAYLQQFPLDALKVDRSFVRAIATDRDTAEIVSGLVAMARQLGLHVVAEGVEHEGQLALLRSVSCAAAQGELFASPLDADAATTFLVTGRPALVKRRGGQRAASFLAESVSSVARLGGKVASTRGRVMAASITPILVAGGLIALFYGPPAATSAPATNVSTTAPGAIETQHAVSTPVIPARVTAVGVEIPTPKVRPANASFDLLHLHRFGSCRGRLVVSDRGVAFEPGEGDDTFALKYPDFLPALADNVLTLKTATNTYRLKAASASTTGQPAPVRTILDRIERFRAR
jgi:diguanylate cyclase (GGDEF)-like protein